MKFRAKIILEIILLFPMIFYGQSNSEQLVDSDKEIKSISYEVIETIRTAFGSTKVVYVVSNKDMIYRYDLGLNNTREVREIIVYKKKANAKELNIRDRELQEVKKLQEVKEHQEVKEGHEAKVANELQETKEETAVIVDQAIDSEKTILVSPVKTYERLVDQGVRSSELFSQLADAYFYKNDYDKASKCYFEFFKIEKKIKPEFYFRYAVTLDKLGQDLRSKELLRAYEALLKNQKN